MHEIKIKEFYEKVKNFNEFGLDTTWAAFSTMIILQAKVKNSAFWNMVNSVVCQNSVALNVFLTSKEAFKKSKSAET